MTNKDGALFARYALESKRIKTDLIVKPKLFEPRKDGTLSVQKIDDLNKKDIAITGQLVAKKRNKTLYGWARITRSVIEGIELRLCIDNNPPGHTNIIGWPSERNIRLDKQKVLALASCGILL